MRTGNPRVTLVCFGLVGSLVVDEGLIERSFAEAIATQGVVTGTSAYARRMAQVHQARGQAAGDVFASLFPDNEARAQAAQLAFDRAVADAVSRAVIRPIPSAQHVLEEMAAAGCRIGVLTSLPIRVLGTVLDAVGWRKMADVALSAEEVPRGFPAPDLVLTAMLAAGVDDVREVAVVHSTGAGIAGGRRSGAAIVAGLLTGPHPATRLRDAGATHVISSAADLPEILTSAGLVLNMAGGIDPGRRVANPDGPGSTSLESSTLGFSRPGPLAFAPGRPASR